MIALLLAVVVVVAALLVAERGRRVLRDHPARASEGLVRRMRRCPPGQRMSELTGAVAELPPAWRSLCAELTEAPDGDARAHVLRLASLDWAAAIEQAEQRARFAIQLAGRGGLLVVVVAVLLSEGLVFSVTCGLAGVGFLLSLATARSVRSTAAEVRKAFDEFVDALVPRSAAVEPGAALRGRPRRRR